MSRISRRWPQAQNLTSLNTCKPLYQRPSSQTGKWRDIHTKAQPELPLTKRKVTAILTTNKKRSYNWKDLLGLQYQEGQLYETSILVVEDSENFSILNKLPFVDSAVSRTTWFSVRSTAQKFIVAYGYHLATMVLPKPSLAFKEWSEALTVAQSSCPLRHLLIRF